MERNVGEAADHAPVDTAEVVHGGVILHEQHEPPEVLLAGEEEEEEEEGGGAPGRDPRPCVHADGPQGGVQAVRAVEGRHGEGLAGGG